MIGSGSSWSDEREHLVSHSKILVSTRSCSWTGWGAQTRWPGESCASWQSLGMRDFWDWFKWEIAPGCNSSPEERSDGKNKHRDLTCVWLSCAERDWSPRQSPKRPLQPQTSEPSQGAEKQECGWITPSACCRQHQLQETRWTVRW